MLGCLHRQQESGNGAADCIPFGLVIRCGAANVAWLISHKGVLQLVMLEPADSTNIVTAIPLRRPRTAPRMCKLCTLK